MLMEKVKIDFDERNEQKCKGKDFYWRTGGRPLQEICVIIMISLLFRMPNDAHFPEL